MSRQEDLRRQMSEVIQKYLQLDSALRLAEGNHFRVSLFGSARIQPHDQIYQTVYEVARQLALRGMDIVTGGGPGLMEAANRAVREAHVKRVWSYGLPLDIPGINEAPNPHLDIKSMHQRFSSRLDEFMRLSEAVIVAPGGIGTALELFYVWQLLQLSMVEPRPVILLGREYWSGLLDWLRETVLERQLINPKDLNFVTVVDTPEEALAIIEPVFEAFREKRRSERSSSRNGKAPAEREVPSPALPTEPTPVAAQVATEALTGALPLSANGVKIAASPAGAPPHRTLPAPVPPGPSPRSSARPGGSQRRRRLAARRA